MTKNIFKAALSLWECQAKKFNLKLHRKIIYNLWKKTKKNLQKKNLREMIPNAPNEAIDLMEKLFTYDPKERLTAL